jgi:hypothetical protein
LKPITHYGSSEKSVGEFRLGQRCGADAIPGRQRPFSVQIVFELNADYAMDLLAFAKCFTGRQ